MYRTLTSFGGCRWGWREVEVESAGLGDGGDVRVKREGHWEYTHRAMPQKVSLGSGNKATTSGRAR